jgi:tetratricopeptide (TPR) repeat protein
MPSGSDDALLGIAGSPGEPAGGLTAGRAALLAAALALATFVAFGPSLTAGFTNYDDPGYVTENTLIRDLSAAGLLRIFSTPHQDNYHPLTLLSHAVEYRFFGLNPFVYHLVNLGLHAANAALLLAALHLLTGRTFLAAAASFLWALHPLRVESVTWIAERRDVLFTFFFLAALLAQLLAQRLARPRLRLVALGLFVFSCLAKAMAVSYPLVLLLVEWYGGRPVRSRRTLRVALPFFLVGGLFLAVTLRIRADIGDLPSGDAAGALRTAAVASSALLLYLGKIAFPAGLSALYPMPAGSGLDLPWGYLLSPFAVLGLAGLVWFVRGNRDLVFGSLFFLATIAPALRQGPTGLTFAADRYTYLPAIGVTFAAGSLLARARAGPAARHAVAPAAAAICVILSAMAWQRAGLWSDEMKLWNDVLRQFPDSPVALIARGTTLQQRGDPEAAAQDYARAFAAGPRYAAVHFAKAYHNYAVLLWNQGRPDAALEAASAVIRLTPDDPRAYLVRGTLFLDQKRWREAVADTSEAIRLSPSDAEARIARAQASVQLGRLTEALDDLEIAVALAPENAAAGWLRADVAARIGKAGPAAR